VKDDKFREIENEGFEMKDKGFGSYRITNYSELRDKLVKKEL